MKRKDDKHPRVGGAEITLDSATFPQTSTLALASHRMLPNEDYLALLLRTLRWVLGISISPVRYRYSEIYRRDHPTMQHLVEGGLRENTR
ncbi:hypothetical protein TMatcc_001824 [Talaromyces marneffei ATCC 18224]